MGKGWAAAGAAPKAAQARKRRIRVKSQGI
jgi:hypothetical protein